MNPKNATAASGGASGALTLILVWVLGLCGIAVPPEVAIAFGTLLTWAFGEFFHRKGSLTLSPNLTTKS
jgi:hypothetical protein